MKCLPTTLGGASYYGTEMEIFASLEAEYDRLDSIFAGLSEEDWNQPSGLAGWTNVDVLLHLAQTEESVVSTLTGTPAAASGGQPLINGVYAFRLAGKEPAPIRADLTGPDGEIWQFGPSDADSVIAGSAGAFCRVGAQRLAAENSGLTMTGPHAESALRLLRNYAA
ncbi:maleylpyruvate isomerase N-terminal domain-containing protein [Actinopolymorpha sp. B11F2]|uniref:maleylpyruvate isomerase N-terminal domain-containing protein n=1 Tax=Actinopolymorpha sp. B11F2 TaxID=3160862 RepID=UPI0032E400D8